MGFICLSFEKSKERSDEEAMITQMEKRIVKALFLSIIIMFIPITISANVLNDFSYRAPMYSVAFITQLFILLWSVKNIKIRLNLSALLMILLYFIILILPIFRNSIINVTTEKYN